MTASFARLRFIITEQIAAKRLELAALSVTLAEVSRRGNPE